MPITNPGVLKAAGLMKAVLFGYKTETERLAVMLDARPTKKAYEEWTGVAGPGVAEEKAKGDDMVVKDIFVETPKRVTMQTFALAVRLAFEDVEDDLYGPTKRLSEMVGRSHKVVREIYRAHLLLNTVFGTFFRTGYDGKAPCATDHPLQGGNTAYDTSSTTDISSLPSRTQTTWSNKLATAADFDYTSYIDAITLLGTTVTREGDYAAFTPRYLLGNTANWAVFKEVTKSTDRPDTANRSISAVSDLNVVPITSPYCFDADAWGLYSENHDFQFFERMPLRVKQREAQGSWDIIVESMQRFGVGIHDPRGFVATPGA